MDKAALHLPVATPLGALGAAPPAFRLLPDRLAAGDGDKRLADLEAAFDRFGIGDGAVLSFHHHYRNGDRLMNAVVAVAQRRGLRGLTLAPSSIFPVHAPLVTALHDGTVAQIVTDYMRGPVADALMAGALDSPVVLQSHGARARAIGVGQIAIDVAFVAAPLAHVAGDVTGRGGLLACGPLGYPAVDARYARACVVAAHEVTSRPLPHIDIPAAQVDAVIAFDHPGESAGIQSGTTLPSRTPVARAIAEMTAQVIAAVGLLEGGLSLQTGAGGYSLAAVPVIGAAMAAGGVRGSFLSGGITGAHVALHAAGLFDDIYDVQCFDLEAVRSAQVNPHHRMMSATDYASPLNPGARVNALGVMILGAVEVDTGFNVNVVSSAQGQVLGGPGGHPDAAAGARLRIVTTALMGGGFAKVVPKVRCIATPGQDVDVLVTDHGIAVPAGRGDLRARLIRAGLPVVAIETLAAQAAQLVPPPLAIPVQGPPRVVIEHRDGAVLDWI